MYLCHQAILSEIPSHNIFDLYSGGVVSNLSQGTYFLSCFSGFPQSLQIIPEYYLKLVHDRLVPQPFQFIIYSHPIIPLC